MEPPMEVANYHQLYKKMFGSPPHPLALGPAPVSFLPVTFFPRVLQPKS
jgi:hypothetical protein